MAQQLPKQDHYDYRPRNLKTVLNCAGAFKRNHPHDEHSDTSVVRHEFAYYSVAHAGFVGGYLSVAGLFQMKTTGRVMDERMSM